MKAIKIIFVNLYSTRYPYVHRALGLEAIKGHLIKKFNDKIDISILDLQYNDPNLLLKFVKEKKPDMLGFSLKIDSHDLFQKIIEQLYLEIPFFNKMYLLVGHVVATFASEDLLRKYNNIEKFFVVRGDGEKSVEGIIEYFWGIRNIFDIPNISFNYKGDIVHNYNKLLDLNNIALPSSDTIYELLKKNSAIWIEASRGCNNNCSFCSRRSFRFGDGWNPIPLENVFNQIELLAKYGVSKIIFADDDIMANCSVTNQYGLPRLEKIAKGISQINKRLNSKIKWECETRADRIYNINDSDFERKERIRVWSIAKQSGMINMCIGIESGSDSQLERYNKKVTAKENENALILLENLRIRTDVIGFIIFDPFLNFQELKENIAFIEKLKLTQKVNNVLKVLRLQEGAPILSQIKRHGLLIKKNQNLIFYDYCYNDRKIQVIAETCICWMEEIFELFYFLKNDSRNAVDLNRRQISKYFIDRLRSLDLELLRLLVYNLEDKSIYDTTIIVDKIVERLKQKRQKIFLRLCDVIEQGTYGMDSEFLIKNSVNRLLQLYAN